MEIRHLFLTGEKQTGKTTILRALLEGSGCTGFETKPFSIGGEKKGYLLHSLTPLPDGMNDCPCVVRVDAKRHTAVLPVFEGAGVQALRNALASAQPVILMDEIGKAEKNAEGFCAAVRSCLDSREHHVIGVLQLGDAPLQQYIRSREDIRILTVTAENRAGQLETARALVEKWLRLPAAL